MSFMEASLIEPVACCLRALNKSNFQKGDSIAIYGAGPAGMMHVLLASAFGAGRIFVIDINQFRLNFATKTNSRIHAFNADVNFDVVEQIRSRTDQMGVDLTVLATGSKTAFVQSFEVTRKGGKVIMFGVPSKGSQVSLDLGSIYSNEQSLITSYAASEIETNQAIKLISEKVIDFDSLITHKFNIKNAADAVDCARSAHDAMKVVITNDR
jgi:L-iditol 2-dehydrogenase